jgi:hypothetical protein
MTKPLRRARIGERDRKVGQDLSGTIGHDQHPTGQKRGLDHRVGDEQGGETTFAEQAEQLVVEPLPGDLVDCTEGLVEEEDLGGHGEGPGQ